MLEVLRRIAAALVTLAILAIVGGIFVFLTIPDLFKDSKADLRAIRLTADQQSLATGLESYSAGQPAPAGAEAAPVSQPAESGEKPNPFVR